MEISSHAFDCLPQAVALVVAGTFTDAEWAYASGRRALSAEPSGGLCGSRLERSWSAEVKGIADDRCTGHSKTHFLYVYMSY